VSEEVEVEEVLTGIRRSLPDLTDSVRSNTTMEWRSILKEVAGVELPPPAVKNISIEGRIVRDGARKTSAQRKSVIENVVKAD
jgi:hypothetical protein